MLFSLTITRINVRVIPPGKLPEGSLDLVHGSGPRSERTVATAVGPDVWELVRPDRPPPADRRARGIPPAQLRRVVESLERIGGPE